MCGQQYRPESRGSVEQVEGDLLELSPEVLEKMRGEITRIDSPESVIGDKFRHAGAPLSAVVGAMKQHRLRREEQQVLREAIALWAGYQRAAGIPDSVSYRRFYHNFGIDVLGAQTVGRREAEELTLKVRAAMPV